MWTYRNSIIGLPICGFQVDSLKTADLENHGLVLTEIPNFHSACFFFLPGELLNLESFRKDMGETPSIWENSLERWKGFLKPN